MSEITPNPTKKFLERSYGKVLTEAEALEYKDRLLKFFSLLIEIDQRKKKRNETKAI